MLHWQRREWDILRQASWKPIQNNVSIGKSLVNPKVT